MFKGNQDSSQSENQHEIIPIIEKSLIINPSISVQHIICSICFHVLWDPITCGSPTGCHNAFCRQCLQSWLQKSSKLCPTCKKPFIQSQIPPILKSILQSLIIKCPNIQNGCEKNLSYSQFEQHIQQCHYKIQKCKGCGIKIIQKQYYNHVEKCSQIIIECIKCKNKMTKAAMSSHSRQKCFTQQINTVGNRVTQISHNIDQIQLSLQKLQSLTNCFLQGQPLQLSIQLYTTFNQHFVFPNPTLIKPSFNQNKQKFDFLHFYVLNPIYTDSIASIKWSIKINKMIGNILIGFCSSMGVNSIDYVINKYGDIKKKNNMESRYRLVRKSQGKFCFSCGDILRFRYISLSKSIKIWNQTKMVGMMLGQIQISELGQKAYAFYSMDTLNDSISFI